MIYNEILGTSIITIAENVETGQELIKKVIVKSKLCHENMLVNARRESSVQQLFHHENIVKLYNYTESDDELVLFMEKINDP